MQKCEIALLANKAIKPFVTLTLVCFVLFSFADYILGYMANKKGWISNIWHLLLIDFSDSVRLHFSFLLSYQKRDMWSCFKISLHHWSFLAEFYICGSSKNTDKWSIILSKYLTSVTICQCLKCVPFQIRLRATFFYRNENVTHCNSCNYRKLIHYNSAIRKSGP